MNPIWNLVHCSSGALTRGVRCRPAGRIKLLIRSEAESRIIRVAISPESLAITSMVCNVRQHLRCQSDEVGKITRNTMSVAPKRSNKLKRDTRYDCILATTFTSMAEVDFGVILSQAADTKRYRRLQVDISGVGRGSWSHYSGNMRRGGGEFVSAVSACSNVIRLDRHT